MADTDKSLTHTIIEDAKLVAAVAMPFLPPNVQLALAIAKGALAAIERANNGGRDVSDEELDAIFDEDEQARLADIEARAKKAASPNP